MLYELRNVTKRYRQSGKEILALDDVSLSLDKGEFLALQGSTGSGKTTLLQMLGGLDRPTAGAVLFEGADLATMGESRLSTVRSHAFGFIFQSFNLIPTLTAQENVETALVPLGVPASERRDKARDALAGVGLADRGNHLPAELSGGEQQRVAIARALANAPRVLLADEPTGNLDVATADRVSAALLAMVRNEGVAALIATHNPDLAQRMDRRVTLREGKLLPA